MDPTGPDRAEKPTREQVLTGTARAGRCAILVALSGAVAAIVQLVALGGVLGSGQPYAQAAEALSAGALMAGVLLLVFGGWHAKRVIAGGSVRRAWQGVRLACAGVVLTAIPLVLGVVWAWRLAADGRMRAGHAYLALIGGGPFVLAACTLALLVAHAAPDLRALARASPPLPVERFLPTWAEVYERLLLEVIGCVFWLLFMLLVWLVGCWR